MQDFKKLRVWERAHQLVLHIYGVTKLFPDDEKYGLTSQMRRSSSSIPMNLAEGCGKYSTPDILRFFQMALGSVHELEYQLILSKDLKYLKTDMFDSLVDELGIIKAMLINLIKKYR